MAKRGKRRKPNFRKRRGNPAPKSTRRQLSQAASLYRKFREKEPRYVDSIRINPLPKVCMEIGRLDGVLYTTTHRNKKASYIHKFTGRSRPTLVASADGKRLFILGGGYNFTKDGIVDRK